MSCWCGASARSAAYCAEATLTRKWDHTRRAGTSWKICMLLAREEGDGKLLLSLIVPSSGIRLYMYTSPIQYFVFRLLCQFRREPAARAQKFYCDWCAFREADCNPADWELPAAQSAGSWFARNAISSLDGFRLVRIIIASTSLSFSPLNSSVRTLYSRGFPMQLRLLALYCFTIRAQAALR